jgi:hypothetical protein
MTVRNSTLTPAERSLHSRLAAHSLHAQGKTNTAPARAAFMAKFEDEVDPERVLPPSERAKRADHAMKAHMARIRLKRGRK